MGFDRALWSIIFTEHGPQSVTVGLRYVSPNRDQGYPGTLTTTAIYTLDNQVRLRIEYLAKTDAPTIVNLSGEGSRSVMDEQRMIPAAEFTPEDTTQIPIGAFESVADTPFDFRTPTPIGRDIRDGRSQQLLIGRGYDLNLVTSRRVVAVPRPMARVVDPHSGRMLGLASNQPGPPFYSRNFLDGILVGSSGHIYRQGDGFALEPQVFPDTTNHPNCGSARLAPGEEYGNAIIYTFSVVRDHDASAPRRGVLIS